MDLFRAFHFLKNVVNRSDAVFAKLVENLGGLVYGSAYRRTNNPQLSEEVTQKVFLILAQKAETLVYHSSLTAWLHRTTLYEADKALRTERRHRRRVDRFSAEEMKRANPVNSPNHEQLSLLEQALNQLSLADRELVLSRFYYGKKFREIAQESKLSEAACKVRLRRVLDKMSKWLGRRGYALSLTALMTLLGNELTKAAPLTLSIKTSAGVAQTVTSSVLSYPLLNTLLTMKITQILIGTATLLTIYGVIHIARMEPKQKESPTQPTKSLASQNLTQLKTNRQKSPLTAKQELQNYPYASERLEELYAMYPNLRRLPFTAPTQKTILEEIKLKKPQFQISRELRGQLNGKLEWDQDAIGTFLESNQDVIDEWIQISQLSTENPVYFNKLTENAEGLLLLKISDLLSLSFQHSIRAGNWPQAAIVLTAQNRFTETMANGVLGQALIGSSIRDLRSRDLLNLTTNNYNISLPSLRSSLSSSSPILSFTNGLKNDFASFVSIMEMLHYSKNKKELGMLVVPLMTPIQSKRTSPPPTLKSPTLEQALALDIRQFEEDYAKVISTYVTTFEEMEEAFYSGNWSNLTNFKNQLVPDDISLQEENKPYIHNFAPRIEKLPDKFIRYSNHLVAIDTLSSINRARADGLNPTSLNELVPDYLSELPKHLVTQEPIDEYALSSEAILEALK